MSDDDIPSLGGCELGELPGEGIELDPGAIQDWPIFLPDPIPTLVAAWEPADDPKEGADDDRPLVFMIL
jgi:hypothetical protein